jgi:hypothetical protein
MPNVIQLGILIGVVLLLIVAFLAWFVASRRFQPTKLSDEAQAMISDAKLEASERPSSIVAEQIEEMVKSKLAGYSDLAGTVLDFGTVADGTIDIWVNDKQYDDVKDIPDERIRKAIEEAIATFNAGKK